MKTMMSALSCAALLLSACVAAPTGPAGEKKTDQPVTTTKKEFKHKLVINKMGCWEFERNPEYVPSFEYGNAVLGVGGNYLECMKTAISMHEETARTLAADLAKIPEGSPERAAVSKELTEEKALVEEAKKMYTEWRERNWK